MTKQGSRNSAYGLLKYISRQPLPVSRWMARILAFIVNSFKVTKTSEVIRLNLEISLSELSNQEREQINRAAVRISQSWILWVRLQPTSRASTVAIPSNH